MNKEFYTQKIKQLTDDRLKELLQLRTKENKEIMELAEKEALERGIDPEAITRELGGGKIKSKKKEEERVN